MDVDEDFEMASASSDPGCARQQRHGAEAAREVEPEDEDEATSRAFPRTRHHPFARTLTWRPRYGAEAAAAGSAVEVDEADRHV